VNWHGTDFLDRTSTEQLELCFFLSAAKLHKFILNSLHTVGPQVTPFHWQPAALQHRPSNAGYNLVSLWLLLHFSACSPHSADVCSSVLAWDTAVCSNSSSQNHKMVQEQGLLFYCIIDSLNRWSFIRNISTDLEGPASFCQGRSLFCGKIDAES